MHGLPGAHDPLVALRTYQGGSKAKQKNDKEQAQAAFPYPRDLHSARVAHAIHFSWPCSSEIMGFMTLSPEIIEFPTSTALNDPKPGRRRHSIPDKRSVRRPSPAGSQVAPPAFVQTPAGLAPYARVARATTPHGPALAPPPRYRETILRRP